MYQSVEGDEVKCLLCPRGCVIKKGEAGFCKARRNTAGRLAACGYGQVTALALDPIEKKPLRHFKQGSNLLSVGSFGCNLSCQFCQNWHISTQVAESRYMPPEELAEYAVKTKNKGNIGVAFTYNEPLINFEFVKDTCMLLQELGMDSVLVSNGYVNEEPLLELAPFITAANIDVKSFSDDFYNKICNGKLEPVKNTLKILLGYCHVEITALIIPRLNDSIDEMNAMAKWLAGFDKNTAFHINRYFPHYNMQIPPVDKETLVKLQKEAKKFLKNVYIGNV